MIDNTYDKSKHYNLLIAENKKHDKKKRVSFSLFQADTFEEIANLRKIREDQLKNFVMSKTKANEQRLNKIRKKSPVSTSEYNSSSNENMLSSQIGIKGSSSSSHLNTNTISSGSNVIKTESKNERKFYEDKERNEKMYKEKEEKERKIKEIKEKEEMLRKEKEMKEQKEKEIKEREIKQKKDKELKELKEKEERELKEKKEKEDNEKKEKELLELKEKEKKELEEKIRKELEEKFRKEAEEKIKKEIEEKLKKEAEEKRLKEIEDQKKREEEQRQKEEEDKIKLLTLQANTTTFTSILSFLFKKSKSQRQKYFPLLISSLNALIQKNIDNFLNYETTDETYYKYIKNKTTHYLFSKYYSSFMSSAKEKLKKKMLYKFHKSKANKYLLYRQYKTKALSFGALASYAEKQKKWINQIRAELSKGLLWSCLDSLKLYVNYKKIKRYFLQKKQKKIFDALVQNDLDNIEMDKKAQKVFLIFTYKSFFKSARREVLISKGKIVNEKIAKEYRKQSLMKKIFNVINVYYKTKKEKEIKSKKRFMVKHENKDYINIQVTKKEVVNFKDNSAIRKISNKINLV